MTGDLISRQGVIDAIQIKWYGVTTVDTDGIVIADDTIKVVENMPSAEPIRNTDTLATGDMVSRQAVYEALNTINGTAELDKAFEVIEQLPCVEKTGRWIMSDDGLYRPICNQCGAHPWKGYIPSVEEATEVFKYCPNCGAKMKGEQTDG